VGYSIRTMPTERESSTFSQVRGGKRKRRSENRQIACKTRRKKERARLPETLVPTFRG